MYELGKLAICEDTHYILLMRAVSKYKPISCADCGVTVQPTSGNFKRCRPCQMKSRGMTGCGYVERVCARCDAGFMPSSSVQRFCFACRPIARAELNVRKLTESRRKAGAVELGTVRPCADCKMPYAFKAGPQTRCKPCQLKVSRERTAEATKRSPLRSEYGKRAKKRFRDKHDFGGNKGPVMKRDGHACRKCGTTEKLCVHHIDGMGKGVPREAQNHAMDNLITLCLTCHSGVHAMTERLLFLRHPDTVREALDMFLAEAHSNCAPQR